MRWDKQIHEARVAREKVAVILRLRGVCEHMSAADFDELAARVAELNVRFEYRSPVTALRSPEQH